MTWVGTLFVIARSEATWQSLFFFMLGHCFPRTAYDFSPPNNVLTRITPPWVGGVIVIYSLRKASIGLSLDALTAGTMPKIRPIRIEKTAAARIAYP